IVILIIAVLLAVALPQLVGSRDAGLDSAAKQQLNNAYTELSAKTLTTESSPADAAAASSSIKTIEFVGESVAGGKQANSTTNTRAVSYKRVGTQGFILAVAGSGTNCWALRVDPAETNKPMAYLGKKTVTTCSANYASTLAVSSTDWEQFGFPSEAKP
ncbi:MAG: type II secretion system protein, partial [Candidatus Paceibacterota bacterium]